jgi:malate dehydrogenase
VPIVLGNNGVERIIELDLDSETKAKFQVSVDSIQEGIDILKEEGFFNS